MQRWRLNLLKNAHGDPTQERSGPLQRVAGQIFSNGLDYLQARCLAKQYDKGAGSLQVTLAMPTGVNPLSFIEFFRAALAMKRARSGVIIVASPPAITQDFADAVDDDAISPTLEPANTSATAKY